MEQTPSKSAKKVWESVQLYTVQCAKCSKWRLIPTKEKYEEIRETIEEQLFSCETARQWWPEVSCADEADVKKDDNLLWAMDRPSIPQTPRGWQRILRLRAEGGTKFADVYYVSPSNKRLRSMIEIQKYLDEHPTCQQEGLKRSKFSFQSPLPLEENYVAKRRARAASLHERSIVPLEVNPITGTPSSINVDLNSVVPEINFTKAEAHAES